MCFTITKSIDQTLWTDLSLICIRIRLPGKKETENLVAIWLETAGMRALR